MNQKLTDWFPPHIKPVRVGWYHTGLHDYDPRSNQGLEAKINLWWDGKLWRLSEHGHEIVFQAKWWRGIKNDLRKI